MRNDADGLPSKDLDLLERTTLTAKDYLLTGELPRGEEREGMKVSLSGQIPMRGDSLSHRPICHMGSEANFDDLTQLAAYICQTPIALLSLNSPDSQQIASTVGLGTLQTPTAVAFCEQAIRKANLLIVQDTLADERLATHPLVTSNPKVRFYAGIPLIANEGKILGTLGVMDYVPRDLSWQQQTALKALSRQVVTQLELHRQLQRQQRQLIEGQQTPRERPWDIIDIFESITDAFIALDREWRFTYLNSRAEQVLLKNSKDLLGQCFWDEFSEAASSTFYQECQRAISKGVTVHFEEFYNPLGIWLEVRAYPYRGGLLIYFRDVTARKQSEAMLMERSRLSAFSAEVGIALGQGGEIDEILNRCTQIMVEHLDATTACIWTANQGIKRLDVQAIAFPSEHRCNFDNCEQTCKVLENNYAAVACDFIRPDSSIVDFIIQTRQAYLTNDLPNQDRLGVKAWLQRVGASLCIPVQAFASYPLIVEERLVGILAIACRQPVTQEGHSMLEWVANAIAVAIDRAWAKAALLSRRESLLFRLASQIRKSLDLDTILGTAVSEIRSLLQIDRCHFLWCWPHPEQPSLTVTHESCDPSLNSLLGDYPTEQVSLLVQKILNLQTIRVDDISSATYLDTQTTALLVNSGITSQLLIPLETHSGQLGAVVCSHCSGSRPWSESEVELLHAVVDQLAIAIDQAELYAQTRAAAFAAQSQAQQLSDALNNLKQTEAQLVHTEKMSSLGQLVAGIAHEINNPVNFIYGNLTYASDYIQDLLGLVDLYQEHYPEPVEAIQAEAEKIDLEFLTEDLPKLLASMQLGTERIRQIVLSLRNFSRLDEADKKPVNIHEGIDNTLLILHNRLKANASHPEIQVVKEYSDLSPVECYAGQLNQVFMNIVANAIDALDNQPEPRIITIRTELGNASSIRGHAEDNYLSISPNSLAKTQFVVIRIRDNGPGMTEDVRKRLFDPFFTTKPVGKGTGLGLSISYQIVVEKHGGHLYCTSKPGEGSEFTIAIPC